MNNTKATDLEVITQQYRNALGQAVSELRDVCMCNENCPLFDTNCNPGNKACFTKLYDYIWAKANNK